MDRSEALPSNPHRSRRRLPAWLKRPLPGGRGFARTKGIIARSRIATVCRDARCPNLTECWSKHTATFMILGHRCTRRCRYCSVETGRPQAPDPDEPQRLAGAVEELGLLHAVITAVARDDLPDEGAGHFARCIAAIRARSPRTSVEVLPADLHARRELVRIICDARPDVYNHNIEMVERLTPVLRPQGDYRRSLEVLQIVREIGPGIITKSGLMLGLGETWNEVLHTFDDLRAVGCAVLTIGQYLAPTSRHVPIARFYSPEEFVELAERARECGFLSVESAPFVRSSYNAAEVFAAIKQHNESMTGDQPPKGATEFAVSPAGGPSL